MTLPPVIRVFFAIDLPMAVKEQIGVFISALKKKSKSHAIRWTKPENLHVTLQFLAEANSVDLPTLINMVREEIVGAIGAASYLWRTAFIPNAFRPLIVMDVVPQEARLTLLVAIVFKMGYRGDVRPFRSLLTLN